MSGEREEVDDALGWLGGLPHASKVVVAGNHDFAFQRRPDEARELVQRHRLTYLQDEGTTVQGLRIWGSPWQPWFFDWAFNLRRGAEIRAKWDLIPAGIDVLVTHGPPAGILDRTVAAESVGCADLLDAVRRVRPRLHVFGHIHEAYGRCEVRGTTYVNACICDVEYVPRNAPHVVELPDASPAR